MSLCKNGENSSIDARKAYALLPVVVLLILLLTIPATTMVYAAKKPRPRPVPASPSTEVGITNNILEVWVESETGENGIGTYTICTGPAHTNPGQDVFYDGAIHDAWSTYNTINVTDTLRDYVTTTSAVTPDPGCTLVNLDTQNPIIVTQTPKRIVINWTTMESLNITQDIEVVGNTMADTYVRVTMNVTNNDEGPHTVGIRYMWDIMIDGYDGSWIRPWDAAPGSWLSVETPWAPPPFEYWETTNDPAAPVFSVLGSITYPPLTPPPTLPDTFMLAAWGSAPSPGLYDYAYSFTPTSRTVAGSGLDSAAAYYWDPEVLSSGYTRSVTAYIWCLYIPPVGGTVLPVDKLGLLAPWIGICVVMGIIATVVVIKRNKR